MLFNILNFLHLTCVIDVRVKKLPEQDEDRV